MKFHANAALTLALGAALLATSLPARAADDEVSFDKKIFRSLLEGLGLRKDGEAINYQERAPLVIPPGRALPPPEKSDAVVANNPAWPKDPDVARRKLEVAQERNRNTSEEIERDQNPLRPDQLTPGGNPRTAARAGKLVPYSATGGPGERLSPTELGYKGNFFSKIFAKEDAEDVGKFTGEPPRGLLTEPPPGYRTPSPDQPYGLSGRTVAPKAKDYSAEHGTED